jgi:ribonuclease P protein component
LAPNKPKSSGKIFGLSKLHRIRKRADFHKLRKNSQKWVSRHWILFYSKSEWEGPRLALSISTKYGNSVARNWYRRWLREKFRLNKANLPPFDLHFVARQKPANCSKKRYIEELNADFEKLLHRLR